jgi:hypothetical protein
MFSYWWVLEYIILKQSVCGRRDARKESLVSLTLFSRATTPKLMFDVPPSKNYPA